MLFAGWDVCGDVVSKAGCSMGRRFRSGDTSGDDLAREDAVSKGDALWDAFFTRDTLQGMIFARRDVCRDSVCKA